MNIAVLGAGAMGMLYGGYLSKHNNVWLIDVNRERVNKINDYGVKIREKDGNDAVFYPNALINTKELETMDLIIVFVKAMYTSEALNKNRHLIGKNTYLMTLQNGIGHENTLLSYADNTHIIIGTTQHNSSIIENGYINHGGGGSTYIGILEGDSNDIGELATNFNLCGFDCFQTENIKTQIWNKLFLNTSASTLTGILQVPLGFIIDDPSAQHLMKCLVHEAVAVANTEGYAIFDEKKIIGNINNVLINAKNGYTSIYADIKNGTNSEVDTISGSVVEIAERLNCDVPYHKMAVALVHAMENKMKNISGIENGGN